MPQMMPRRTEDEAKPSYENPRGRASTIKESFDFSHFAEARPENAMRVNGHDAAHNPHHVGRPNRFMTLITAHPCACYCLWFWVYFMCLGGTLIAFVAAPSSLQPISMDRITEVGLELPYTYYYKVQQAFYRTPEYADLGEDETTCLRESLDSVVDLIITDLKDENILTQEGLTYVDSVIADITGVDKYSKYCALYYGACDSEYTSYRTNAECCVQVYQNMTVDAGTGTYDLSNDKGCLGPVSPVQYFQRYGDPDFSDIPGTLQTIKTKSPSDFANLQTLLGSEFDIDDSTPKSQLARVSFYYGSPLHNETVDDAIYDDVYDDEVEDMEEWLDDTYSDLLQDLYEKNHYSTRYTYSGYDPLTEMVLSDLSKAIIGICLVLFYMWFSFGSAFLACNAMFMILMAFFGANLVYRYLWPTDSGIGYEYFTLFNGLSIFIILGIGADDSFVLNDTWIDSGRYTWPTVAHRLSHVFYQAGKAMAVTSATTVISFFSNMGSQFIGIKSFGTFAGLLVIINYIMVISFWPSVVYCYEMNLKHCRCCICLPKSWFRRTDTLDTEAENATDAAASPEPAAKSKLQSCIDAVKAFDLSDWLADTYAPALFKFRYFVLAGFGVFVIIFFAFACLVRPTPFQQYTLAPPGHNFHEYYKSLYNDFPTSANPLYVYLIFGLNSDSPLTFPNKFNSYDFETGEDGTGEPNFDTSMDVTQESFQSLFYDTCHWIADKHEFTHGVSYSGLKLDSDYGVNPQLRPGGDDSTTGGEFGVQCLMDALAQHENVTNYSPDTRVFSAPHVQGAKWPSDSGTACRYCFNNFSAFPLPSEDFGGYSFPDYPIRVSNTSNIIDNCNCLGMFPIPRTYCLAELAYLSKDTHFNCFESDSNYYDDLNNFFRISQNNYNWWKDYIYATTTSNGDLDRVAMTYIKVQTTVDNFELDFEMGLKMCDDWQEFADKFNDYAETFDNTAEMTVYNPAAAGWLTTSLLTPNAVANTLLSLFLGWLVLMAATFNWVLATMAIFNVGLIVTIIFGFLYAAGWGLGVVESILCVLVVGFSVDFTVHTSDTFVETDLETRFEKTQHALRTTGVSVVAGALSTLLAASPMLSAQIVFFQKFGVFMFLTIGLSLVFSLGFFCSLLMVCGPMGNTGRLENFYGPYLLAAYDSLNEEVKLKHKLETVEEEHSPIAHSPIAALAAQES